MSELLIDEMVGQNMGLAVSLAAAEPCWYDQALSDAMQGLHHAARLWDGVRPFGPFAAAVIRNRLRGGLRSYYRKRSGAEYEHCSLSRYMESGGDVPVEETVTRDAEAADCLEALLPAMAGLPERTREVVAMRFLDGMSRVEVVGVLHISRECVRQHELRGLALLAQAIGGEGTAQKSWLKFKQRRAVSLADRWVRRRPEYLAKAAKRRRAKGAPMRAYRERPELRRIPDAIQSV